MFEKKVEVLNKFGETLAIFKSDEEENNRIIDPNVTLTQNSDNIFTFSIPEDSKKWEQIKNIENLYKVDGHIYSPLFSDSYTKVITEDNQNLVQVKAYERQKLLEKVYVTAWNSTTGFERIDKFMVVILSKGDLPLTNDGNNVDPGEYSLGSAGYILKGLLYGTGWDVGIVDVEGTFDFETEQLSVYENILKVQELYGGILIFDSANKIVHLRDEVNYESYSGYEVRRQKNMKNFEEVIDNQIITKLYVFGEAGLNIAAVNDNKIYIENYSYSNETYEGILTNADIYEQDQLLAWGKRNLLDLCRPRKTLNVGMVYLNAKKGFENEEIDLNDTVDVVGINHTIKYNNNKVEVIQEIEKLRVVSIDYKVFNPIEANIELGDTTRNTTNIFKKISRSTNAYTSGTIDSNLLKNYESGRTVTEDYQYQQQQNKELGEQIEQQGSELNGKIDQQNSELSGKLEEQGKNFDGKLQEQSSQFDNKLQEQGESFDGKLKEQGEDFDNKLEEQRKDVEEKFEIQRQQNLTFETNYEGLTVNLENVANKVDSEGNRISTVESAINDITITTSGLAETLEHQGGNNLLVNSSAYFDGDNWRGVVKSFTNTEIQQTYLSKNCFLLQNGTIGQNIAVPNGSYYIGFKYKKLIQLSKCQFLINDNPIELTELDYTDIDNYVEVTDHNIKIEITTDTNNSCYIGDIIVVPGSKQNWSANSNEVFTSNIKIGEYLEISSNNANTKFRASTDGTRTLNRLTNEVTSEFTDKGTITEELQSGKSQIAGVLHQQVGNQTWLSSLL